MRQTFRNSSFICVRTMTMLASGLLMLAGCQSGSSSPQGRDKGPAEVGFRVMRPTSAPLETDLPGRVAAARSAEVRPQIAGVIQQRLFTEGALVRMGQPLYRIDASQYQASVAQAQANLVSAEANAEAQQARAARYRPLAEQGAIAAQDYTDAAAAARQARASIAQTRAALQSARINLRYTTVPAPITGRRVALGAPARAPGSVKPRTGGASWLTIEGIRATAPRPPCARCG